jgi:hypothetical protein
MGGLGEVKAAVAEIRRAYYVAASLRDVVLSKLEGDRWSLAATVVSTNPMWLAQQPLDCVLPGRSWKWRVLTLQVGDGALSATLGPLEG